MIVMKKQITVKWIWLDSIFLTATCFIAIVIFLLIKINVYLSHLFYMYVMLHLEILIILYSFSIAYMLFDQFLVNINYLLYRLLLKL